MVDPRGVEPLSENPLTSLSPWAVDLWDFPIKAAEGQAILTGSPFCHDCVKGEATVHVHR